MNYLLIKHDNGYSCQCCQQTWESNEVIESESDEELKAYIDAFNNTPHLNTHIIAAYKLAEENPVWEI